MEHFTRENGDKVRKVSLNKDRKSLGEQKEPSPEDLKDERDSEDSPDEGEKSDEKPDFSEYMWMENEEEFDNKVMKQLEEEALMEECIEAMLEDVLEGKNSMEDSDFIHYFEKLGIRTQEALAKNSTLNPEAAEFVPRSSSDSP